MYPTTLNVIVEYYIHHWLMVVATTDREAEDLGMSVQDLVAYFYADEGIVTLTQMERL